MRIRDSGNWHEGAREGRTEIIQQGRWGNGERSKKIRDKHSQTALALVTFWLVNATPIYRKRQTKMDLSGAFSCAEYQNRILTHFVYRTCLT